MVLHRLTVEGPRVPPFVDGFVVFFAAGRQIGIGEVRKNLDEALEVGFDLPEFFFLGLVRRPEFLDLGENGLHVAAGLFDFRNRSRKLVLLGFG